MLGNAKSEAALPIAMTPEVHRLAEQNEFIESSAGNEFKSEEAF